VRSSFRALGTEIDIQIAVETKNRKAADKAIRETKKLFEAKQKIFDRFDPESEISRLNRRVGKFQPASPDFLYLAQRALRYNEISDGLYDPRIIEVLEKIGYNSDFRKKDFSNVELPPQFDIFTSPLKKELLIESGKLLFKKRMDFSGIAKGYITDQAAAFL